MKTFTNQMNWFDQKNQLNQKINLIFKNRINRLKKKNGYFNNPVSDSRAVSRNHYHFQVFLSKFLWESANRWMMLLFIMIKLFMNPQIVTN